jgi:hypothetical protein
MEITLSPQAEELLRSVLARHPGQSPADILEQALAERAEREAFRESSVPVRSRKLAPEEFDRWLETFTQFSDKIPPMRDQTFSREMIYQDHD